MDDFTSSAATTTKDPPAILQAPTTIVWSQTAELQYELPPGDNDDDQPVCCFHCGGTSSSSLQSCAKCRVAVYCQRSCQVADWSKGGNHKSLCALYARVPGLLLLNGNQQQQLQLQEQARNEIFSRIRFYACPYAVHQSATLGRGFLFLQTTATLATLSLGTTAQRDGKGHLIRTPRSVEIHFLTVGEYNQEVCRDDFEMAAFQTEIQRAVDAYDPKTEVVVLMKFRCGHVALGTSKLAPDYAVCKQLGAQYYSNITAGSLTLNLDS